MWCTILCDLLHQVEFVFESHTIWKSSIPYACYPLRPKMPQPAWSYWEEEGHRVIKLNRTSVILILLLPFCHLKLGLIKHKHLQLFAVLISYQQRGHSMMEQWQCTQATMQPKWWSCSNRSNRSRRKTPVGLQKRAGGQRFHCAVLF